MGTQLGLLKLKDELYFITNILNAIFCKYQNKFFNIVNINVLFYIISSLGKYYIPQGASQEISMLFKK